MPQVFVNGVYVGNRDMLKEQTNDFDISSTQKWYHGSVETLAWGNHILPTEACEEESDEILTTAVELEELEWKSFILRRLLGFEHSTVAVSRIRAIIEGENWAFGKHEVDAQIRRLASAGVFCLPGLDTQTDIKKDTPVPDELLLEKLSNINILVDLSSVPVETRSADVIVVELREVSVVLYEKLLFSRGHGAHFENVTDFPGLWKYFLSLFGELQNIYELEEKAVSFRTAFFINLYNIFHFAASAIVGSPKTSAERVRFFALRVRIGQHSFPLDDIEHGVLRGVRFEATDPRASFVVPLDPRIHFALNCGAKSCPAISVYSSEESALNQELTWAAAAFCSENVRCDENTVTVSRLFSWYRNDFVPIGSHSFDHFDIIHWIVSYAGLDPSSHLYCNLADMLARIAKSRDHHDHHHIKLKWAPYEWARVEEEDSDGRSDSSSSSQAGGWGAGVQTGQVAMAKSDIFFHLRRRQEKRFAKSRKVVDLSRNAGNRDF